MFKNKNFYKFAIISVLGLLLYLVPFNVTIGEYNETTILIGHFTSFIKNYFYNFLIVIILVSQLILFLGSTVGVIFKYTNKTFKYEYLNSLFVTSIFSYIFRIVGVIFFVLCYVSTVTEIPKTYTIINKIISADIGGQMFSIVLTLYCTFFIGVMLMPLITTFGAVEFIGILVSPFMRKIFNVPGYAAVDATASFVGDGTIGIVVTDTQYQRGYYTQKEAALIASTFSIVGIAFASAVATELGFGNIFGWYYLAIFITTVILAIIMSKIPYKKFSNEYYDKKADVISHEESGVSLNRAVTSAVKKASSASFVEEGLINPLKSVGLIYITFIPIIMFAGTIGLIISSETGIFTYLAYPFIFIFQLLGQGDDSVNLGIAMVVGFIDMYLPVLFVSDVSSQFMKFFVGVMTFAQLIFLSETGMMLIKSKIGFNFLDLIVIYLARTVLAFFVIYVITYVYQLVGLIS